jgi:hypothetical protein
VIRLSEISNPRTTRQARAVAFLLVVAALAGCATTPVPYIAVIDAYTIVRQNASDMFEVGLDRAQDGAAVQTFLDKTQDAKDRKALLDSWRSVPALNAKGDLLQTRVFDFAIRDHRWPTTAPPEIAYVKGVRDAATTFLKGGAR